MKKIVLIIRVSSDKQSNETQKAQLIEFCITEGYSLDDMIIIENVESATQKNEMEGLKKLKQTIQDNEISSVYVWELSRLCRRYQILENWRNLFIENKINLISKRENFRLLDENLEANFNSLMQFDMFKNMIENETRLKNERVQRGINAAYAKNRYVGGKIPFGYRVDENKQFQIDLVNSQVVQLIFQLYGSGNYSIGQITKELINRGLMPFDRGQLQTILKNKAYKGEKFKDDHNVNDRLYPAIVTPTLFNKCNDILTVRSNKKSDKSKGIYYASRLVKCSKCGTTMVAINSNNSYICGLSRHNHDINNGGCYGGDQVNLNLIDSLAINEAFKIELNNIFHQDMEIREATELKINEIQLKIDSTNLKLDKIKEIKRKQIVKEFSDVMITKEIENLLERKIKIEKQNIDNEILEYDFEIKRLKNSLVTKSKSFYQFIGENLPTSDSIKDKILELTEKQRYDIVHQHIKEIFIINKNKRLKLIEIHAYNGQNFFYEYDTTRKNKNIRLFNKTNSADNTVPLEWDKYIIERFGRK